MPSSEPGRLLIVDDEFDLMTALREMLRLQGYEVVGVASARQALEALQAQSFDLLLTDLMMPEMDGIALLQAALDLDPYLVGIVMTGQGTVQSAVEAMKSGAFDYVLKPFKLDAVLPILSRALDVRRLRLENVQLRETVVIYELSKAIAFALDSDTILQKVADAALQQCDAEEVSIMLPTSAGDELIVVAVRGEQREHLLGTRVPLEQGIAGWVARYREALTLDGEVDDARFAPVRPRPDIRSAISMPMLAGNKLVGVLNVNTTRRRPLTVGQVKALAILAGTAAPALEAARLYEQVRQSAESHRLVLENVDEIVYRIQITDDPFRGTPQFVSRRVENILGYKPEEFLEDPGLWGRLMHPDDAPLAAAQTEAIYASQAGGTREYRLRHKVTGEYLWLEDRVLPQFDEAGRMIGVFGVARDVTERKQREGEREAIITMANALRAAPTRAEMLPVILDQLLELLNANSAALVMRDPATGESVVEMARGEFLAGLRTRLPPGEGVSGHVIATGQPYLNNDVRAEPRLVRREAFAVIRAAACVPLIAQGRTIGALWLGRSRDITPDEVRLLAAIADMTANAIHRATLHEQTERNVQRLTALRTIDTTITGSLDLRLTLSVVLDQVTTQLGVDAADVLFFDSKLQMLSYAAGRGFRSNAIARSRLRLGEGHAGRAALERRTVHVPGLPESGPAFARAGLLADEGFIAYYGVPLVAKGSVKGVLELFQRAPLMPDPEWLDFLETIAGQAAIAIDDAELFEGLQRSNVELALAYDATIEGWSRALDLRDRETEGHTQRVTEMTLRLAHAMGMFSEEALVHVRRGALLHDIGKMGIPDGILLKPGPLTEEEWTIMRQHPVYARDLLAPIIFLRPALEIPYCHHEKWDGTGYPRGLRGEAIPLAARLFALADVWDALRSDRPYRAAWPEAKVRDYMRSQSGLYFDPQVVETFLMALDGEPP